ncbi:MAG: fasciclin domain-containing protein [Ornithinimicrobium sp.]
MSLRTRMTALASATAVAAGLTFTAAAPASALSEEETGDFLGQLTASYNDPLESANDRNPYDFDIVTKAVLLTGTDATLAGLDQFTLFAPNDRAFEVLAYRQGLLGDDFRFRGTVNEKAVTEALVEGLGAEAITEVLLYHTFADAKVTGADVLAGKRYQRLGMANGQNLGVKVVSRNAHYPLILLRDKDGRRYNDWVVPSKIDVVETDNAVVHGISDVLLPRL